jgi:GNAT superfamily N-acetyltransferase
MEHLVTQVEVFSHVLPELRPLFPRHWEELALDRDTVPLDPNWSRYAELENAGAISMVTLRAQGHVVGYCVMLLSPGLHYKTCFEARMDMFWIAPEYRGRMGGVRLFRAVEAELKRRGVRRMYVGSKLHRDSSRLFEAMGYTPIERWFSKTLET